eukprot:CAMPEP_0206477728 /NCGR_PEP_ID=MMETSP0324_2-20121206/35593_1 /ASSEMBLY_ACC=CAM_ASM_000836 /TAXON_ID=2866 /ORGANISM="Crypthecodinium cohnii, Strain Seligo" /LENGTH=32 /DNA_ID= /DNA_START= /DNA_END= /DNA_ORIENTATION=
MPVAPQAQSPMYVMIYLFLSQTIMFFNPSTPK